MKTLFALVLGLLCNPASALVFDQVQPSENTLTFAYKQMGVLLDGKFKRYNAQVSFDPAKLGSAQARIEIELASIDTGSTEADEEVVGKKWFNAKTYPTASFVASSIKALGGNRYEASGKLSIKGRTLDVIAPVSFQQSGARGVFDGSFILKRLDYAIGEGEWADVTTVANEIQIRFHFIVNAAPSKK
ncbi:MAG: YceI family protein [Nitrosomonadales bacterium]|nr:YceI family protein [Nitrosomonadales bacterium]